MDFLQVKKRTKISLEELEKRGKHGSYPELYDFVQTQTNLNRLAPVKASKLNGKKPALYNMYWILPEATDHSVLLDEIKFQLHPRLKIDYYLKNPEAYAADRTAIQQLNAYFNEANFSEPIAVNERSFEIWQREKFLGIEGGQRLLKNLGLTLADLNVYHTAEPIAYYAHHKKTPQNVLIIENKDTFFSMRKHLLAGNHDLLGVPIGTLVYGGGKKVSRAFSEFSLSVEPYLLAENHYLYFGDLDYEGIGIYYQLARVIDVQIFKAGYEAMLKKSTNLTLPKTKLGQHAVDLLGFLKGFDKAAQARIQEILERGDYIPQEVLSLKDF